MKYLAKYALRANSTRHRKDLVGNKSFSQAGQDLFALFASNFKSAGSFVEIGAHDPVRDSNTFLLEQDYGWRGVSFEINAAYAYFFNRRRLNPCVEADATQVNYGQVFAEAHLPTQIDYLQVDIDPAYQSLKALERLPLENYRFRSVTFEHDRYQEGDAVMLKSREILLDHGYVLLMPNIQNVGLDVEDWWVDPQQVSQNILAVKQQGPLSYEEAIRLILINVKQR